MLHSSTFQVLRSSSGLLVIFDVFPPLSNLFKRCDRNDSETTYFIGMCSLELEDEMTRTLLRRPRSDTDQANELLERLRRDRLHDALYRLASDASSIHNLLPQVVEDDICICIVEIALEESCTQAEELHGGKLLGLLCHLLNRLHCDLS
jgi:hypothetical protein